MNIDWHIHSDDDTLAQALAQTVATDLAAAIAARGQALIALSGGSTPRRFMEALAQQSIDWSKVIVTLVDERWVPPTHPRSNAGLLDKHFLRDAATAARFEPLYVDAPTPESALPTVTAHVKALPLPFDVVVLGMGTNGHTASFFPGGDHLAEALDPKGEAPVLPMRAPEAGEPRITLTLPVLIAAPKLYLQIEGAKKRHVLEEAADGVDYPMRAVLEAAPQLQVYWCE
ncbi:MAG TPA: 6-phosphogluconolactonase [Rhodanobacteraceae bacterium]